MKYIVTCPNCGKMYKTDKQGDKYITDYGDNITDVCIFCRGNMEKATIIKTDDWIAHLIFTVKGK